MTIAKAGMHASLNARCSVVGAANPVYGQYDRTRRPQENIGLPDSLLSRFDLLFIVLDLIDPALDRHLSEHVIRSHQYRRAGTSMEPEPLNQTGASNLLADADNTNGSDSRKTSVVWQKGGRGSDSSVGDGRPGDVLTKEFLRKYLHYAKSTVKPVLSDTAMEAISTAYSGMRGKQTPKNVPVTARSLETIIRLSSAHAKARLSQNVEDQDVEVAVELMNFVLFHEVGVMAGGETDTSLNNGARSVRSSNMANRNDVSANVTGKSGRREEGDTSEEEWNEELEKTSRKRIKADELDIDTTAVEIPSRDSARYNKIQSTISKLVQTSGLESIPFDDLQNRLNSKKDASSIDEAPYGNEEIVAILLDLERQNKVIDN